MPDAVWRPDAFGSLLPSVAGGGCRSNSSRPPLRCGPATHTKHTDTCPWMYALQSCFPCSNTHSIIFCTYPQLSLVFVIDTANAEETGGMSAKRRWVWTRQ
ncbi:hypothetical protein BKA82DRAFT_638077 [Pisolithus tinctorius]|uniref:Uncharacterized protein n=1 Tax=Pisolithus tinctorius Marx 270 TaxID=870435 RepID=A0A0C3K013_PISTI|nr:hypothetical protein BKA82DRAFT_638077 [Pisolithus tinctorius]KIO02952.1 hypothetical protein M404DRAFT_638077 [Pisolithus tinctorius Marx 270]